MDYSLLLGIHFRSPEYASTPHATDKARTCLVPSVHHGLHLPLDTACCMDGVYLPSERPAPQSQLRSQSCLLLGIHFRSLDYASTPNATDKGTAPGPCSALQHPRHLGIGSRERLASFTCRI